MILIIILTVKPKMKLMMENVAQWWSPRTHGGPEGTHWAKGAATVLLRALRLLKRGICLPLPRAALATA